MLLIAASLLSLAVSFPFEITPQPVFPVPDPTPAEPCGLASRACIAGADCASGFCNILPGHSTGCCQDTQWPVPGPQPTPASVESACPISIPLCITDMDCGHTGYCNHTNSNSDFFGCCQFGPAPSEGPFPFPDPVPTLPPAEICPAWVPLCIADAECGPGQACSHLASNSDVFGCCHPVDSALPTIPPFPVDPTAVPFPFPDPVPTLPPAEICPAWVPLCIADAECGPGQACSHTASNSDVFGCCHYVDSALPTIPPFPVDPTAVPFPFPDPFPTGRPVEQICPASVALCLNDVECGPGQECSHLASNDNIFGCCHPVDNEALPTIPPFVPPVDQPRCNIEFNCLADADCDKFDGRCEFIFGEPQGCCAPKLD